MDQEQLQTSQTMNSSLNADLEAENTLESLLNGRFKILRQLGKGGQGCVYLAEDAITHQQVSVKQILVRSVEDWKQYELFQREAAILQNLKDIPGIAKLHETYEFLDIKTPMAVIVQDYFPGESIQDYLNHGHRFRIDQIGDILCQLLTILETLHTHNPPVIHRDIKPSNMIIHYDEKGQIKVHLIDFGAVANPQLKGGGSTVVGTYGYMAPEQLMGAASPQSDLYSLAIVAVYLLSGVPPENYEIRDFQILIDPLLEHLPYAITSFLYRMLAQRAEERFTDYDKIRHFFKSIRDQQFDSLSVDEECNVLIKRKKYRLKDIKYYNQPGNIEIWQSLSTKTPRTIPNHIRKHFYSELFFYILYFVIFILIVLSDMFFITAMVVCNEEEYNAIMNGTSIAMGILNICWFCGSILATFFVIIGYKVDCIKLEKRSKIYQIVKTLRLMKIARKSMATVTHIEYVPIANSSTRNVNVNESHTPTWRVKYCFNPPDDASKYPIVRQVKTHYITDNLKEGDIIPILYYIDKSRAEERVYSMPFPSPFADESYRFEYENTDV